MRKAIVLLVIAVALTATSAFADEYVNGYMRQDGTYVQPHFKTSPNSTKIDNYSSRGNTNPYTGERGSQPNEYNQSPYGQRRGVYGR
jgi:opacity protein-like surface antigen